MHHSHKPRTGAASAERSAGRLLGAIEAIRHGVIIVESGCGVICINTEAERIVRACDGIEIRSGRIAAAGTQTKRRLDGALHAALDLDGSVQEGRSFVCGRPSGKRPYVIHVLPLHQSVLEEPLNDTTALVLILDPEQENQPAPTLLRQLYKFTNTEAEIA
ncbi:MAG: helix-turn-helix transcriptional regulator, partial [Candidatus Sericytochromatia bacterium]